MIALLCMLNFSSSHKGSKKGTMLRVCEKTCLCSKHMGAHEKAGPNISVL